MYGQYSRAVSDQERVIVARVRYKDQKLKILRKLNSLTCFHNRFHITIICSNWHFNCSNVCGCLQKKGSIEFCFNCSDLCKFLTFSLEFASFLEHDSTICLWLEHTSQDLFYKWTKISSLEIDIFGLEFLILKSSEPLQSCCCLSLKGLAEFQNKKFQTTFQHHF